MELSCQEFICEYKAECRSMHCMFWSQSGQSWASWHSDHKMLRDIVVFIYKCCISFHRGHGSSTSTLFRKSLHYISTSKIFSTIDIWSGDLTNYRGSQCTYILHYTLIYLQYIQTGYGHIDVTLLLLLPLWSQKALFMVTIHVLNLQKFHMVLKSIELNDS